MNPMRTELACILDRSGSMSGLEGDTIGGYNSLLRRQREQEGEVVVTTVLFDDRYELLHDRADIRAIADITESEYYTRGNTALLDAIGRTIDKITRAQAHLAEGYRADKVVVVITTDGLENASREYTLAGVRQRVEQATARGWEFLFLGANIDAIETARGFGIAADRAANYRPDARGTRLNYEAVSAAIGCMREAKPLSARWKAEIDEDFANRKP